MIIGLSGKMGTGKSTLANYIQNSMHKSAVVKIAGLLYELQDMIYEKLEMVVAGEKDRPLLIALGMRFREMDENFWTSKAMNKAKELSQQGYTVIIDDIRFPNEAKAVEDAGGLLVRIEGLQRGPNLTVEAMTSVTETALDVYPFEYRISNLHNTIATIAQLDNFIKHFQNKHRIA